MTPVRHARPSVAASQAHRSSLVFVSNETPFSALIFSAEIEQGEWSLGPPAVVRKGETVAFGSVSTGYPSRVPRVP